METPETKAPAFLEGKEIDGKIGDEGSYFMDVDAKGNVVIEAAYTKQVSGAEVKASLQAKASLFTIAEGIAAKTGTPWDDKLVAGLKSLLGIVD